MPLTVGVSHHASMQRRMEENPSDGVAEHGYWVSEGLYGRRKDRQNPTFDHFLSLEAVLQGS